jgi:hypothetical protein
MDFLKNNYTESCTQYLKNKKVLLAIQGNGAIVQEKVSNCLRQVYKKEFVKKIILPSKLISAEVLNITAEESFEQALILLFEDIRAKKLKPGKNNYEKHLFLLFTGSYFGYLTQKLAQARLQRSNTTGKEDTTSTQASSAGRDYDITLNIIAVLEQLSQCPRDYFIWYYVDKFNVSQITAITGLTAEAVKENLWMSRENVCHCWKRILNFPTGESITRQQYFLLCDYFENNLSSENEELLQQFLHESQILEENVEHELYLRFGIENAALLAQISKTPETPFQTAAEFISRVKEIAESS